MAVNSRLRIALLLLRLTIATSMPTIRRETTQVSLSASGEVSKDIDISTKATKTTCMPKSTSSNTDEGYADNYRGWYDVQGCGFCFDYCRWVGQGGADGGDPAIKTIHDDPNGGGNQSWWSCRLAGEASGGTDKGAYSTWTFGKCAGEGAAAPQGGDDLLGSAPPAPAQSNDLLGGGAQQAQCIAGEEGLEMPAGWSDGERRRKSCNCRRRSAADAAKVDPAISQDVWTCGGSLMVAPKALGVAPTGGVEQLLRAQAQCIAGEEGLEMPAGWSDGERRRKSCSCRRRRDGGISTDVWTCGGSFMVAPEALLPTTMHALAEVGLTSDYCSFDFPLGTDKTDGCQVSATHPDAIIETTAINGVKDCTEAARQAGVDVTDDFLVEYDDYGQHPVGCFTVPCLAKSLATMGNKNPHGQCYYYNPVPETTDPSIAGFSGQPVCKRPRVLQGTEDTNGADSCKDGYEPIKDEDHCLLMQECLGKCRGGHLAYAQFRIDMENTTLFNSHPKWCFIRKEDNCVYFNEPFGSMTDPTNPVGWPLCNVTTTTQWSSPLATLPVVAT